MTAQNQSKSVMLHSLTTAGLGRTPRQGSVLSLDLHQHDQQPVMNMISS